MKLFSSSIGLKCIMALSGSILILFIITHLIGNLGIFNGQEAFNDYSAFLHSIPKLLWIARIGLITAFVLHIYSAIRLSLTQKAARPIAYQNKVTIKSSLSSRTMLLGGLVVLAFILYHLAHLTFGITDPQSAALVDGQNRPDVYSMVVIGFQNVYVAGLYIVAQIFLAMHLSHGFSSAGRTLGVGACTYKKLVCGGQILAWIIFALYISIPVAVLAGFIHN